MGQSGRGRRTAGRVPRVHGRFGARGRRASPCRRAALPAGTPRRGDHLRGARWAAQPRPRPGRESACTVQKGPLGSRSLDPGTVGHSVSTDLFQRYKDALRRGHVAVLRGRLEEALGFYQEATRLAPERALPYTSLGGVHLRLDNLDAALAAYDEALGRVVRDETALAGRAEALARSGRRVEACRSPRRLVRGPGAGGSNLRSLRHRPPGTRACGTEGTPPARPGADQSTATGCRRPGVGACPEPCPPHPRGRSPGRISWQRTTGRRRGRRIRSRDDHAGIRRCGCRGGRHRATSTHGSRGPADVGTGPSAIGCSRRGGRPGRRGSGWQAAQEPNCRRCWRLRWRGCPLTPPR